MLRCSTAGLYEYDTPSPGKACHRCIQRGPTASSMTSKSACCCRLGCVHDRGATATPTAAMRFVLPVRWGPFGPPPSLASLESPSKCKFLIGKAGFCAVPGSGLWRKHQAEGVRTC